MRKAGAITAILIVALAAAATAIPYGVPISDRSGKIIAVDDAAKTFTCREKTGDTTYETRVALPDPSGLGIRNETIYWLGETRGSWTDLKVGDWVRVSAHEERDGMVADKVELRIATGRRPSKPN